MLFHSLQGAGGYVAPSGSLPEYINSTKTTASGASVAITTPTDTQVDDYVILFVVGAANNTANTLTFTAPSVDWDVVYDASISTNDRRYAIYVKQYEAGDGATLTVTGSVNATISAGAITVRNGVGILDSNVNFSTSNAKTTGSLTVTNSNSLVVVYSFGVRSSSATNLTVSFASPYTEILEQSNTANSRSAYFGAAYNTSLVASGTLSSTTVTWSGSNAGVAGFLVLSP